MKRFTLKDYENFIPEIEKVEYWKAFPKWHSMKRKVLRINIVYYLQGKVKYIINDKTYFAEGGDVVVLYKNDIAQVAEILQEPISCYTFLLEHDYEEDYTYELPFPTQFYIGKHLELIALYKRAFQLFLEREEGYYFEGRAICMQILSKLMQFVLKQQSPYKSLLKIEKIKQYIMEHYSENIQISNIANVVDLQTSYVGVYFKKHAGISIKNYINYVRIRKAQQLLINHNTNVTEASSLCGFKDVYYFSRVFKKTVGISPREYIVNYNDHENLEEGLF